MKRFLVATLVLCLITGIGSFAVATDNDSEDITIELFYSPWASTPTDYDPYEEYLENKYNCDFVLSPTTDFDTQLLTRATADDMPDLILFDDATTLMTLYNQGVLLDDWTPYLEEMTQTTANMSDLSRTFFTVDGKIVACPGIAGDQKWSFCVRKDWLGNLGLSTPTNDSEFLDMLRAFTYNDPDGNGEDDTYGITSAGGNSSVGELRNLLLLYDAPDFYITDDGAVTNYIYDGNFLSYLQLARTIVSEGLIDPDWYTQGWDERKPNLYAGKFGVCWYPASALLTETNEAYNDNGATAISMWDILPMYSGKLKPDPIYGAIRTVSAAAAADEKKMEIIVDFLENGAYPNEEFFKFYGYEIDTLDVLTVYDDGTVFLGTSDAEKTATQRAMVSGSIVYGWIQMLQAQGQSLIVSLTSDAPTDLNLASSSMISEWYKIDKYNADYKLLNPDPTLYEESEQYIAEFEIDFILGNKTEDDYDQFVSTWKELYGDALLQDAVDTFTSYGLLD